MILAYSLTHFLWCYFCFIFFCCSVLIKFTPGYPDLNGFNFNLTGFNTHNLQNFQNPKEDQKIRPALSEQLKSNTTTANQLIQLFTFQPLALALNSQGNSSFEIYNNSAQAAERNIRESDAERISAKQAELQHLLQALYQAEAAVRMEAGEIARSQQTATEAEQTLEEATNKVRMLSSHLQAAQEYTATCAMRAHTAQLQLAAHDQLMFTARQQVDALSAQLVSVQAELASIQNSFSLNESSKHLEQQGHLSNIYQLQSDFNDIKNNNQISASTATAAIAGLGGVLILPPGEGNEPNN